MPDGYGNKVRVWMMGNTNSTGKPKPEQWKKKLLAKMARSYAEPGNIGKAFLPNYNEIACEYFDWLNKWMKWDGQYAIYKGEKNVLSYFVDYYEPTQNIVVEWDEKYHKYKKKEDLKRQDIIKEYLGCKFYRVNDLTLEMKEV